MCGTCNAEASDTEKTTESCADPLCTPTVGGRGKRGQSQFSTFIRVHCAQAVKNAHLTQLKQTCTADR